MPLHITHVTYASSKIPPVLTNPWNLGGMM